MEWEIWHRKRRRYAEQVPHPKDNQVHFLIDGEGSVARYLIHHRRCLGEWLNAGIVFYAPHANRSSSSAEIRSVMTPMENELFEFIRFSLLHEHEFQVVRQGYFLSIEKLVKSDSILAPLLGLCTVSDWTLSLLRSRFDPDAFRRISRAMSIADHHDREELTSAHVNEVDTFSDALFQTCHSQRRNLIGIRRFRHELTQLGLKETSSLTPLIKDRLRLDLRSV